MNDMTGGILARLCPRRAQRVLTCGVLLLLLLSSCSSEGSKFRLEGRLRNINQGELYIYNMEGSPEGVDTIAVRSGRFSYETELDREATLVLVFPNYSEQPVFARPGKTVSIKGDASHLKELIIQGTTPNEDMTSLRMELNDLTPPDIPAAVSEFIRENPESPASVYALQRYLLFGTSPDYASARKLVRLMLKEQPTSLVLKRLEQQVAHLSGAPVGASLPRFKAKDIKGRSVSEQDLRSEANVVATWATWSWRSGDQQRKLRALRKLYGDRLGVLSICLDGKDAVCRRQVERDSLSWPVVCDGRMWESSLVRTFGLSDVPAYVLIDGKGRVKSRPATYEQLEQQVKQILKQ